MPSDVRTGTVLAGFRIESLIGEGAMGAVYLAEDLARRDSVALKVLDPELAQDERFRQRFLRESQLAASLDHPNIVPIIASGDEGGVLYLAMEYVDGVDLRELLRREGRLEPERALALLGSGRRRTRRRACRGPCPPGREAGQHPGRDTDGWRTRLRLRLRARPPCVVGRAA